MAIERQPINLLQNRRTTYQNKLSAWQQVNTKLLTLKTRAEALTNSSTMGAMLATSSDTDILTATVDSTAAPGTYSIEVLTLAQAHKISSDSQTDKTSALGYSGEIVVNGKAITIESSDTLITIKNKINSVDADVQATILEVSSSDYRLVLTSTETGADNEIKLSDVAGANILGSLGLLAGTTTKSSSSYSFSSSTTAMGSVIGLDSPAPSGTIQITDTQGTPVSFNVDIDLETDSLSDIADAINSAASAAGSTVTAQVTTVTENGETKYRLDLTNVNSYIDSNNILEILGLLRADVKNELQAAQDASLNIDGISGTITRSTNTITDLIEGVTLTLNKAQAGTTVTLTVSRDIDSITTAISDFINAYNDIRSYINTQLSYDTENPSNNILMADPLLRSIKSDLSRIVTGQVSGLPNSMRSLAQIGITTNTNDGTLSVDDSTLTEALTDNFDNVKKLFMAVGSSTDADVSYVSKTSATKAGTYAVYITTVAEKATITGDYVIDSGGITNDETLTFTVGSSSVEVSLSAGDTISEIVTKINSVLDDAGFDITASNDGGKLKLTHDYYGSSYGFSVVSDQPSSPYSTGIGTTTRSDTGVDVAGTINSHTATGSGQYLTGASGYDEEGLKLKVTATSTGSHGSVTLTIGVADQLANRLDYLTDTYSGPISLKQEGLEDTIDDIDERIEAMEDRLTLEEERLREQFTAMEQVLSQLQVQTNWLTQWLNNLTQG